MTPGVPPTLPDPQPDIANLSDQELASNQEARVAPWFAGTRKIALTWISPTYNLRKDKLKPPPAHGGLFNSPYAFLDPGGVAESIGFFDFLKNQTAPSTTAYYGDIAGLACCGPVDAILGILVNGGTIWPTNNVWADGVIDLPTISRRRKDNEAHLQFATPHTLRKGNKFIVSGFTGGASGYNAASPVQMVNGNGVIVAYSNTGSNDPSPSGNTFVSDTTGRVTKVVHYGVGDLVRDGSEVWQCNTAHDGTPARRPPNPSYWDAYTLEHGGSNPATIDIPSFGTGYLYWGTSDQTLNTETLLSDNDHPPYRFQAVLVLKDFLFGQTRNASPSVEVVVRRAPVQSIITGDAAELDEDGQANPVACLAELLTHPVFGIGRDASAIDADSWQALADDLAAAPDKYYISPFLDKQETFRALIGKFLSYFDGWCRWNAAGKLQLGRFLHNEAPPSFTDANTVDFHDVADGDEIKWDSSGLADTTNQVIVRFEDKERAFKPAPAKAVSGLNRQIIGEPRQTVIERPWITREAQALAHAAEACKIYSQQKLTGQIQVRAEKLASVLQGDVFRLTHDELSLSIVARAVEKTLAAPPVGKATIRFESERGVAPIPFQPTPAGQGGTTLPSPEAVDLYQVVQPPAALVGSRISVLAARKTSLTHGLRVWMRKDDTSSFYLVGQQTQWAVYGELSQDYDFFSSAATERRERTGTTATIKVTGHGYPVGLHIAVVGMTDTDFNTDDAVITSVPDADHFTYETATSGTVADGADTGGTVIPLDDDDSEDLQIALDDFTVAGDLSAVSDSNTLTADAINDNAVLVWVFNQSDPTDFEVMTLKAIRLDSGVYKLKVRRNRFNSGQKAFTAGARAFIIHRANLATYANDNFDQYSQDGATVTFRLQSFTDYAEADLTDSDQCPDVSFTFTDPYAPSTVFTSLLADGVAISDFTTVYSPTTLFTFSFDVTDANADMNDVKLVARLGTVEFSLWSQSFTPTGMVVKTTSFYLTQNGVYRVFVVARDQSGRVVEKELEPVGGGSPVTITIQDPGSVGTACIAPVVSPASAGHRDRHETVTITCATSGATIHYSIVNLNDPPGSYTTYSGVFGCAVPKTLYAYASKGGLADSPVVRVDYYN